MCSLPSPSLKFFSLWIKGKKASRILDGLRREGKKALRILSAFCLGTLRLRILGSPRYSNKIYERAKIFRVYYLVDVKSKSTSLRMAEELVEQYQLLCIDKPTTEEEKQRATVLSAERKVFLEDKSKSLGYKSANELKKELEKILKKREPKKEKKKAVPSKVEKESVVEEEVHEEVEDTLRRVLGEPQDNLGRGDYYVNDPEILQSHLDKTGGKYQLRFPPEPNGWLHIGHAKAMSVNFGFAEAVGGNCYLRFDDTNPEAEEQEYIDGILENVAWLGYKPFRITYTSNYFDVLYCLAQELIRRGKAYMCFLTESQVKSQRNALKDYHNAKGRGEDIEFPAMAVFDKGREETSYSESLIELEHMRQGRYAEGEASLRMKGDFHSPNPNMWDHMAYRIKYCNHPRTKDAWCIYPTYDYSHCLVDSIESISHSLCTLEFETRQSSNSSYHWLLHVLGMYHPKTYETSRCSISCNVMSKRRLHRLVQEGYVHGWDDPRLLTLSGLRRRGYTASSVKAFCRKLGVARSSNEVCVMSEVLEGCIRSELDAVAPRRLGILAPIKIRISNFVEPEDVLVPNHPQNPEMGERVVSLTETIYIPGEKFRLDMIKGYKGMVPASPKNASIKLLNSRVLTYVSHTVNEDGVVDEIVVSMEPMDFPHKGMSVVTWVPSDAVTVETRLFGRLFNGCDVDGTVVHAEKAAKEKGVDFVELFNKDSLQVAEMKIEKGILKEIQEGNVHAWQFITVGYFCVDLKDSTTEHPVLNMIVSLKEDKTKLANNKVE